MFMPKVFALRRGSQVPFPERLQEAYQCYGHQITANVSAEHILPLMESFIAAHEEPLFFILELPAAEQEEEALQKTEKADALHKNIYYLDGCTQEDASNILRDWGTVLCHDGLCAFGFGGHLSGDEITLGKYNVAVGFSRHIAALTELFEAQGIPAAENLVTAWNTFTPEAPGNSWRVDTDGRSVFDLPTAYPAMYRAEQRAEQDCATPPTY